uniref:Protein SDA1 n=1 Tax=Aegilops tauschii subsp. strangulata TaxID=200361 RepID=A0A453L4H6_AEGTS
MVIFLYPYAMQPHQRDVTTLLAAAVQACHEMVPPDAVEPLFKQIVNQFVHDRSRPEAIAVGLNVVREICMRIPLMMNEDLLQDLVLYKKSHEKAVSIAARSLITLFREICPSLLVKKDRGRPIDPTARPKAFGETTIASDVPGAELLDEEMSPEGGSDDESDAFDSDDDEVLPSASGTRQSLESLSNKLDASEDHEDEVSGEQDDAEELDEDDSDDDMDELDDDSDVDGDTDASAEDEDEELNDDSENEDSDQEVEDSDEEDKSKGSGSKVQKRKLSDYIGQLDAADASLRALKKLAGAKKAEASTDEAGRIFGDEDFKRIKELKAKKAAKLALVQHGLSKGDTRSVTFKLPSTDELSLKRVDPSELAAHVKRKMTKEERLEMVKAGREDRGKYQARAAIKQKKTGGSSNKQKQHQKRMPLAAKRAKAARSRQEKKTKAKHSGKQFRGRKAWK